MKTPRERTQLYYINVLRREATKHIAECTRLLYARKTGDATHRQVEAAAGRAAACKAGADALERLLAKANTPPTH